MLTSMIEDFPIANMGMHEAVELMAVLAGEAEPSYVATMNTQLLRIAKDNADFRDACMGAELRFADGRPLVWASRLAGDPLVEQVSGSDLEPALCARLQAIGGQVIYIGGRSDVNEQAVANRTNEYPGLIVSGVSPSMGYEKDETECLDLVRIINRKAAEIAGPLAIMLCTGAPKSELWAAKYLKLIDRGVILPAGAAVDFAAGEKKKASNKLQQFGLAWLVRLVQEPVRLGPRYTKDAPYLAGLLTRSLAIRLNRNGGEVVEMPTNQQPEPDQPQDIAA